MPKLITQHTSKLFFNKFKYKAVVKTPRTSYLRYASRSEIEKLFSAERLEEWSGISNPNHSYHYANMNLDLHEGRYKANKEVWENRFTLYKLYNWITTNYNKDSKIRNEGNKLAFYTNDESLWLDLTNTFKNEINEIVWPKNEAHSKFFDENPTTIICKKLPYDKYRYKINLRGKVVHQAGFSEWISNYNGELKASGNLTNSIRRGYLYSDGKFLYSTNSEMMLLLQMYLGDTIRNIQEYITEAELDEQHTN